jgi:hypothetical protein
MILEANGHYNSSSSNPDSLLNNVDHTAAFTCVSQREYEMKQVSLSAT